MRRNALDSQSRQRILILGGTRFIGPWVVRALIGKEHEVTLFHRGETAAKLPLGVRHIPGDRTRLRDAINAFQSLAPHTVIDMIAYTQQDAADAIQTFSGIAARIVVLSSMDVYRAFDRLRGIDPGPSDDVPLTEDAPLRSKLYPYRAQAKNDQDFSYTYEKILVERAFMAQSDLPATVLRLPAVYGHGDHRHRLWEYLKRMDDHRPAILMNQQQMHWRWTRGYVENIAAAIALAATDPRAAGRIYNIGESQSPTEAQWVRSIAKAACWNGDLVAVAQDQLPIHLRAGLDWKHDWAIDTTRIHQELGYVDSVPGELAMQRAVKWERENPPTEIDQKQFDYAAEDAVLTAVCPSK